MSDIDFLAEGEEKKEKKKTDGKELPADFDWTKPEGQSAPVPPEKNLAGLRPGLDLTKTVTQKAESASNGPLLKPNEVVINSGQESLLAKFFRWLKKDGAASGGFKAGKQAMAESGKIYSDHKKERKNSATAGGAAKKTPTVNPYIDDDKEQWHAPKVLKTNLIQGEIAAFIDWKAKTGALAAVIIICSVMIALAYVALYIWEIQAESRSQGLASDIGSLKQKIIVLEAQLDNVNTVQNKLTLVSGLLDNHVYWTNVLKFIEDNTLAGVFYSSGFSYDTTGKFSFSASAENYRTITDQINVFKANADVLEVSVAKASLIESTREAGAGPSQVNFQLELVLDPKIYKINAQEK